MSAVWMRFRAELRGRRRAWFGLALLIGVFGGAVLGAAAGASRTGSVVDRYVEKRQPPDIFIVPVFGIQETGPELRAALSVDHLRDFPSVADGAHAFLLPNGEGFEVSATDDRRLGTEIFPIDVIEGRLPDLDRADEATVNVVAMNRLGLHAGDTFTIHFESNFGFGEEPPRPVATVAFRITGVTLALGEFAAIAEPGLSLTPAFLAQYGDRFDNVEEVELSMLRLRNGAGSYDDFRTDIETVTKGVSVFYVESAGWSEPRRSFGLQADSLWILAGVVALVAVLVLGQTISRQTSIESAEHPTLRSLGFTRGQLVGLGLLRAAAIGIAAGLAAIVVAAGTSPLAPFGNARLADPDPAFSVPAVPIGLGVAAVVIGVILLAVVPSWRAARVAAGVPGSLTEIPRPARVTEAVSRTVPGPSASVGIRMAFERGRGRTAVPVRTTITATGVGLVALTAALVVGSSLNALTKTPRLYGWNWDVAAVSPAFNNDQEDPAAGSRNRAELRALPGIAAASFGPEGGQLLVNGVVVVPFGLELGAIVAPPLLEGRAPAAPDEIAIARKTLAAADAQMGDIVQVGFQGTAMQAPFRVVGITVVPITGEDAALGNGVWIPVEDLERLFGQPIPMDRALIRFTAGADREAIAETLGERFQAEIQGAQPPGTVVDFGAVSQMPQVLAGIVGLLAAGTIGHGLVTAVRRRRRDLSILKALGLDRRQARSAVAWQASATAFATLTLAIPLGVIGGRLIWIAFANATGFVATPIVDLGLLSLTIPAALLVANLIAALPARMAARTVPAVVLRTE
jgi:ABC-type antimicrobial peptide transport system permease subunit